MDVENKSQENYKIMVFQKRARKCAEFRFFIGNQIIDVVQEYTYLGSRMSSSGNFSVTLAIATAAESYKHEKNHHKPQRPGS